MEIQSEEFIDKLLSQIDEKCMLSQSNSTLSSAKEHPQTLFYYVSERFAKPKTDVDVKLAQESAEPHTTAQSTKWALNLWSEWSNNRITKHGDGPSMPPHLLSFEKMNYWMSKFILEVRRKDGLEYPPNTLYCIVCGVMRHIRKYCPEVNFFTEARVDGLKKTLDSEMKRTKAGGAGSTKKRVEPISFEEEEMLWEKGLLGSATPHTLLDTMVYMCGIYFALRSGQEHRDLKYDQIKCIVNETAKPHLVYTENTSKNNPGGLKHRKIEPKIVSHYASEDGITRCFVSLYKLYISHCPLMETRKTNAFYLTPLKSLRGVFGTHLFQ